MKKTRVIRGSIPEIQASHRDSLAELGVSYDGTFARTAIIVSEGALEPVSVDVFTEYGHHICRLNIASLLGKDEVKWCAVDVIPADWCATKKVVAINNGRLVLHEYVDVPLVSVDMRNIPPDAAIEHELMISLEEQES